MASSLSLSTGAQAQLVAAATRLAGQATSPGLSSTQPSVIVESGLSTRHLFTADVYSAYPTLAEIQTYLRDKPVSIPIRSVNRKVFFALWTDGLATFEAAGSVVFERDGAMVFELPFNVSRTADTAATNNGVPMPGFDVWRLDPSDSFVIPAAGDLAPGALHITDTGTAYRYVTTLAPLPIRVAADRARVHVWQWNVSATLYAAACIHLSVISEA